MSDKPTETIYTGYTNDPAISCHWYASKNKSVTLARIHSNKYDPAIY